MFHIVCFIYYVSNLHSPCNHILILTKLFSQVLKIFFSMSEKDNPYNSVMSDFDGLNLKEAAPPEITNHDDSISSRLKDVLNRLLNDLSRG